MKVMIVDDEPEILTDISSILDEHDNIEIIGSYENPLTALSEFPGLRPDCLFLDIEMPGINGIDLAQKCLELEPSTEIVFLTAFNNYATEAFSVNAIDYVLKPVNPVRLGETINRVRTRIKKPQMYIRETINIRTLGSFEVLVDGKPVRWNRSKARELLAYLLHHEGRKRTKFKICEDLWPEYEPRKALVNLQTAICSLRKSLGDMGRKEFKIEFVDESYVLKLINGMIDSREFDELQKKGRTDIKAAKNAISLYQGEYMEGEDWVWAQLTAESLSRRYEELLHMVAEDSFSNKNYKETIDVMIRLAHRLALDEGQQLLLARAAYESGGISGLKKNAHLVRSILLKEHDLELEEEFLEYCRDMGLRI